jgi:hypothetical protein
VAKSELIDKIRDAFLSGTWPEEKDKCAQITAFCDFAADWLAAQGVVGVGYAASGLALRMADGREIGLVQVEQQQDSAQTPPVSISTVKATPRGITLGETGSHHITGR